MTFHSHAQEEACKKALRHPFQAVAFDVDGTLTHFSRFVIPKALAETLVLIPAHIPRAICTGRDIDFIHTQLEHICSHAKNPLAERTRWTLFVENGAKAYHWNKQKKDYEALFEVPWPKAYDKEEMEKIIRKHLGRRVVASVRAHTLVMRNPSWTYLFPRLTRLLSRQNHGRLDTVLKREGWDKDFIIQDSGIGNVLLSKKSGKGNAMRKWAKHLDIPLEDILVVGDQPKDGGNDADFLSGKNGTPFTVGELTHETLPFPVHDKTGHRMKGPEGTKNLLERVRWA